MERTAESASRRILRVVAVVTIAAYGFLTCADIALVWHPIGSLGITIDSKYRIIDVVPGGSAARAGIRTGDRIDMTATPFADRQFGATGIMPAPLDRDVAFAVRNDHGVRLVSLRATRQVRSLADDVTNVLEQLASIAMILIGAWLVLVRPSGMTWALYLFCAGYGASQGSTELPTLLSANALLIVNVFGALFYMNCLPLAIFALRFPNDRVTGARRHAQTAVLAAFPVVVGLNLFTTFAGAYGLPIDVADTILGGFQVAGAVFVLVAFLATYLRAQSRDRAKVRWVGLGLLIGYTGPAAFDVMVNVPSLTIPTPIWLANAFFCLGIAVPLSVAYVVVRHRVFDVRFVLGRAAVYGLLTTLVVSGLTMLDFAIGKLLSETRLAVIGDAAAAVVVGLMLNSVHKRIEALIEALFFRARRRAEERLRRVGEGAARATTYGAAAVTVVDEVTEALGLASCALFRRVGDQLVREAACGWEDSAMDVLPATVGAPLTLAARSAPLDIRDARWPEGLFPAGRRTPVDAIPIHVRNDLYGVLFVGEHAGGERPDPEELAILTALARDVALAYEHLEATDAVNERDGLLAENAALRDLILGGTHLRTQVES